MIRSLTPSIPCPEKNLYSEPYEPQNDGQVSCCDIFGSLALQNHKYCQHQPCLRTTTQKQNLRQRNIGILEFSGSSLNLEQQRCPTFLIIINLIAISTVHFLPKKLPQLCFPMNEVKQHRRGLLHMIREPPQTSKSSSKKIPKPKRQTYSPCSKIIIRLIRSSQQQMNKQRSCVCHSYDQVFFPLNLLGKKKIENQRERKTQNVCTSFDMLTSITSSVSNPKGFTNFHMNIHTILEEAATSRF